MKYKYIKPAAVKAFIKSHGKRTSHEYLAMLDRYVEYKLKQAVDVHNGGKKTVDGGVGSYSLGLGNR